VVGLEGEPAVAQRYLPRPLLLNGLKFDLRVYALVASAAPLRIYVYREGLARFATVPYAAPRAGNLGTARMHLTNYAVNRGSAAFEKGERDGDGSKWSLSTLLAALRETGAPPATLCIR
jgi:Tubulin-tyrosine ligase family